MSNFDPAYRIVRKHEGYYANDPDDLGGETYAGVARAIHPNWSGWPHVDNYKYVKGPLSNNQQIPGMEPFVKEFYRQRWIKSRAGEINNQNVANIYFDFFILAAKAVATIQEVVNTLGQRVSVDNHIGSQTIAAINKVNPVKLYMRYKQARINYHLDRVRRGIVHSKYLPGWLRRTNQFPDLKGTNYALVGLSLVGAAGLYISFNKKARKQVLDYLNAA